MADPKPAAASKPPAPAPKPKAPPKSKRERWNALNVKRVRNARRALRNVVRMANTASYEYTADEAATIVKLLTDDVADMARAFKGAPKERGLYDL